MIGDLLEGGLLEPADLDAVEQPAQHPGRVAYRLLPPQVGVLRAQDRHVGALVVRRHLEREAGARRGLLEQQRDIPPGQRRALGAVPPLGLEVCALVDQVQELGLAEVGLLEQGAGVAHGAHQNLRG